MKKYFILITLLCMVSNVMVAQKVRLNGYAGYVFDDEVSTFYTSSDYYEGKINGGFRWGVGLEYMVKEYLGIEISYQRQDTKAPIEYYDILVREEDFDVGMNWIMIGGVHYLKKNPKIEPYGGGRLGVVIINVKNPSNGNENSATKFAWGLRGGINLFLNEKIGIKLQADLHSGVQAVGGSLYFGTGGAGAGVSSYSSLLQFGLGGGLVFKLGGK